MAREPTRRAAAASCATTLLSGCLRHRLLSTCSASQPRERGTAAPARFTCSSLLSCDSARAFGPAMVVLLGAGLRPRLRRTGLTRDERIEPWYPLGRVLEEIRYGREG